MQFSNICAALVLAAAGSAALVADEESKPGDCISCEPQPDPQQPRPNSNPQQPRSNPQPNPNQQQPRPQASPNTQQPRPQQNSQQRRPAPKKEQMKLGISIGGVAPVDTFADAVQTGFGLGGFLDMPLGGQLYGVATVQYNVFGEKEIPGIVTTTATTVGGTFDLNLYFEGARTGLYGLAGVGYYNCTAEMDSKLLGKYSHSESVLGFEVGGGYYLNKNFAVEAKYFAGGDAWAWAQISVNLRF